MDTKPRLLYFDFFGRGEPIRMLFSFFKIDFEDVVLPFEGFENEKHKYKYGKLPVVEMDGMAMPETRSILRYICLKNGHHPTDPVPNYKVNQILDHFYDIEVAFYNAGFFTKEEDQPEALKKFFHTTFASSVAVMEDTLKENVSQDYLVGDKLTAADVVYVDFVYSQVLNSNYGGRDAENKEILKKFPLFNAYIEKRKADFPRLENRPNWAM